MTASSSSDSITPIKIPPPKGQKAGLKAQNAHGRSWQDLTKSIAKGVGYAALAALGVLSVAALIVGIVAMVNPIGLGVFGASIAGLIAGAASWVAENAFVILITGAVGSAIAIIATGIIFVFKKCFPIDIKSNSNSTESSSQSGSTVSVT